jgi:hypothetical protein
MKALSVKQPWAGLIAAGIKNIENRTWRTNYTGLLVIVSSKLPAPAGDWQRARAKCESLGLAFPEALCKINAAAIGTVTLHYLIGYNERGRVVTDHPEKRKLNLEWWNRNGFGWIFEGARVLTHPVPVTGRLNIYTLPDDAALAIAAQL